MITMARCGVGQSAVSSVLLPLSIVVLSAACASIPSSRRTSLQVTPALRGAGLIPGSWEKVEGLRLGSSLVVTLKTGERLEGAFKALALGSLILTNPAGKEFSVPRSEVGTIVARVRDDLANGALIGAGIGFGAAQAILAIVGSGDGYVLPSAKWGAPLLLSGIGSLVGAFIDRSQSSKELIFRAP